MTLLELDGVTVGYDTPVLREIDLAIEAGEIVGVVGKNGVGKTTLMKTVVGLLEPMTGTITYDGRDITGLAADERARSGIGYIPQGRDIFPDLTVEENLRMGEHVNADSDETRYELNRLLDMAKQMGLGSNKVSSLKASLKNNGAADATS